LRNKNYFALIKYLRKYDKRESAFESILPVYGDLSIKMKKSRIFIFYCLT